MVKRISFLARRGEQPPKRIGFSLTSKNKLNLLWGKVYALVESKTDDSKYINPIEKDNPHYRSGVNDGLRVALKLITLVQNEAKKHVGKD